MIKFIENIFFKVLTVSLTLNLSSNVLNKCLENIQYIIEF